MTKRSKDEDRREEQEATAKAARLAAYGKKFKDPEEREEHDRAERAKGHDELRGTVAAAAEE